MPKFPSREPTPGEITPVTLLAVVVIATHAAMFGALFCVFRAMGRYRTNGRTQLAALVRGNRE